LSLGDYPTVSLKQARERRDEIRRQVAMGINPSEYRKQQKQAQVQQGKTLAVVAQEWIETSSVEYPQ